ncbi:MAG TPA: hypothetical protein VJS85_00945 [Rhizomicrobium sp.]|nr:hypothetical protein [Rhizomicrobium sp.]
MNPPKKGSPRTAKTVFDAWDKRTEMVKLQTNAESAANDAKTVRLKALRLEKERQDAIEAAANPKPAPVKVRRDRRSRANRSSGPI